MNKSKSNFFISKKFTTLILPIILITILGVIAYFSFSSSEKTITINEDEALIKSEQFINDYLMDGGSANIKEITKEYGLYKLSIDIGSDQLVDSYITQDGILFFPQALNIDEIYSDNSDTTSAQESVSEVSVKSDKPIVELFVMSHCPYGTQMEKAIIPAIKTLGNTVDFQLKFNDYAMHGQTELAEQTLQYCLIQENNDIYLDYLDCFLVDGNSDKCLAEVNVSKNSLNTCITETDEQFSIMSDFNNNLNFKGSYPGFNIFASDNEKYSVQGSPTLVINGQTISANRTPASILDVICTAFTTQPEACNAILSNDSPTPGFGTDTTSASASTAACN